MARAYSRLSRQETVVALGEGRRLVLGEELGSGSSSSVYRAALEGPFGLARPVALKVFDPLASDERDTVAATLAAAARALACVRHPNVAEVHEYGVLAGGRPFLVEELVTGPTLDQLARGYAARGGRVPLDLALFLGVEIAEGLAGARQALARDGGRLGLVHGDLTPREVLLSVHGEVKVADFGVATAARAASSVRSFTEIAKRAAFLAPEVVGGEAANARSDVFSLGVLAWEMLVGPRFPKDVDDARRLGMAREGEIHTTLFDPQLPAPLKVVLRRALDPSPERRFAHAGAFAFELRRLAFGLGVGDGRAFLRHAIARLREDEAEADDAVTNERIPAVVAEAPTGPLPALAPNEPSSGVLRRAVPRPDPSGEAR